MNVDKLAQNKTEKYGRIWVAKMFAMQLQVRDVC